MLCVAIQILLNKRENMCTISFARIKRRDDTISSPSHDQQFLFLACWISCLESFNAVNAVSDVFYAFNFEVTSDIQLPFCTRASERVPDKVAFYQRYARVQSIRVCYL